MGIFIHPTAIVETEHIGDGTFIGPYCYITERVRIGRNCKLLAYVSIGTSAEYRDPPYECNNFVEIGDRCEIREFVTINAPIGKITRLGNDGYMMTKSHIGHDATVGDFAYLTTSSIIGGHSKLGNYCYIGLGAATHPWSELGDFCLIGSESFFKGKSPGGIIWAGVPARPIKINKFGLEKNKVDGGLSEIIESEAEKFIKEWGNKKKEI